MRIAWLLLVVVCLAVAPAIAQEPVKVDPKHYKVEFENDRVRVLRITYGPHEKSVMHSHPSGVAVFLTDSHGKFTYPDGKSVERDSKAGQVRWATGETHLPENLSDKPEELILVELKVKPATAKPVRMSSRLTLLVFKDRAGVLIAAGLLAPTQEAGPPRCGSSEPYCPYRPGGCTPQPHRHQ